VSSQSPRHASPANHRSPVKTLSLIRHAKSSWKYPGLDDRDRPLNARGVRDSALMGMVLSQRGFSPARMMTSPALRAIRTAEAIASAIGYPVTDLILDRRLYHAGPSQLLGLVKTFEDELEWVACVGHNPGFTELVNQLVGNGPDNVATCAIAEIRFHSAHWNDVGPESVVSFEMDKPKNHK
jgi:phosphohistidine phosphatase